MPDITMCMDKSCPVKETCYRFVAKPKPSWQSYFMHSPREYGSKASSCREYWPVSKSQVKRIDTQRGVEGEADENT